MKKLLLKSFLLIALMSLSLTGRAQNAVAVSELSYSSVEALPFTVSEALGEGDESIVVMGTTHFADGYQFALEHSTTVTIQLESEDGAEGFNTLLQLYDDEFNLVASNRDYMSQAGVSYLEQQLEAGTYYVVVTVAGNVANRTDGAYSLSIRALVVKDFSELNYYIVQQHVTYGMTEDIYGSSLSSNSDIILFDVIENAGHAGAYASGYKIEVDATTTVELVLDAKDPFDPYLILLDENYEIIAENDDDEGNQNRSLIRRTLMPGIYHIIVTTYGEFDEGRYRFTINAIGEASTFSDLSYQTLNLDAEKTVTFTETTDVIYIEGPIIYDGQDISSVLNSGYYAAGFQLDLPSGSPLMFVSMDSEDDLVTIFLDEGYNVLGVNGTNDIIDGGNTYYVIILANTTGNKTFTVKSLVPKQVFLDPVEGNDANTGIKAEEAVRTFSRAIAIANGLGVINVMNDLEINNTYDAGYYLTILPTREDITITATNASIKANRLKIGGNDYELAFNNCQGVRLFEANGLDLQGCYFSNCNYFAIASAEDSLFVEDCSFENDTATLLFETTGSKYVALYNVYMSDCVFEQSAITGTDNLYVVNTEFTNNVFGTFAYVENELIISNSKFDNNNMKALFVLETVGVVDVNYSNFTNCTVTQSALFDFNDVAASINMDHIEISGCHAETMMKFINTPDPVINGLKLMNNTSYVVSSSLPAGMDENTLGGIILMNTSLTLRSTITFGPDNYIFLFDDGVLNIDEDVVIENVFLMPVSLDETTDIYTSNYQDGLQVLTGSNVENCYGDFHVAQHVPGKTWTIDNEGRLALGTPEPGPEPEPGPDGISDIDASSVAVFATGNNIVIRGAEGMPVSLYDMAGRAISTPTRCSSDVQTITAPHAGVYLVRVCSLPARRVVVMSR
ncbi:MAG: right-handed parallel beta-helix repeat-containing protein [Bacteroidales bacterium]|nr:right-handed parallel beta-helix repeat-containing protein [Bacteroidales bacterium]